MIIGNISNGKDRRNRMTFRYGEVLKRMAKAISAWVWYPSGHTTHLTDHLLKHFKELYSPDHAQLRMQLTDSPSALLREETASPADVARKKAYYPKRTTLKELRHRCATKRRTAHLLDEGNSSKTMELYNHMNTKNLHNLESSTDDL